MRLLRIAYPWGLCPQTPEICRLIRQNGWSFWGTGCARPLAIPAAGSALGSHLCVALSSAQVLPGWTTSTSPCNDLSSNGDYPLNFVSHSRGSLHWTVPLSPSSAWMTMTGRSPSPSSCRMAQRGRSRSTGRLSCPRKDQGRRQPCQRLHHLLLRPVHERMVSHANSPSQSAPRRPL